MDGFAVDRQSRCPAWESAEQSARRRIGPFEHERHVCRLGVLPKLDTDALPLATLELAGTAGTIDQLFAGYDQRDRLLHDLHWHIGQVAGEGGCIKSILVSAATHAAM